METILPSQNQKRDNSVYRIVSPGKYINHEFKKKSHKITELWNNPFERLTVLNLGAKSKTFSPYYWLSLHILDVLAKFLQVIVNVEQPGMWSTTFIVTFSSAQIGRLDELSFISEI